MSWLEDIERTFKYECSDCGGVTMRTLKQSDPSVREDIPCAHCGSSAKYSCFLPIKMHLRGKVAFDQNGRKAYAITDGRGNVRYTSATKEHYLETGDIKPHYTRPYEEHLIKTGHADQLETVKHKDLVEQRRKTKEYAKTLRPQLTESAAKTEE
jgi:DNA-directed RNA polymerase subunit RPC12/RpoP